MNKNLTLLFFLVLTNAISLKAQNYLELTHRHEVRLNLGSSILLSFPEISYEYLLNEDMTIGAAVGFSYDTEVGDGYSFRTTPFARWFFSSNMEKPAKGFFIEANGTLGRKDAYIHKASIGSNSSYYSEKESKFDAGLGLGFGWKYLSKNNWTGEVLFGVGRNFFHNNDGQEVYSRIGLSVGKRF